MLEGEARSNAIMPYSGSDSNLLIVFYVQIMPDDLVMQLHRFENDSDFRPSLLPDVVSDSDYVAQCAGV